METEVKEVEETEKGETPETKTTETVVITPEELQKKIDELTRHAKNKEEEAARVQKKLEAFELAEAERKKSELSEVERAKQEKQEADARAEKAEKELADQRATIAAEKAFAAVVAKLNLGFFNDKAREDAFALMDMSKPTEFENVIKKLKEEKPYLFKDIEVPDLDAKDKGKIKNGVLTDAQKAELKKRFRIK